MAQPRSKQSRKTASWDRAGLCYRCTFAFVQPVLRRGARHDLEDADLDLLPERDRVGAVADRLEREWRAELDRPAASRTNPSLWRALYRAERSSFWASGVYCLLESTTRIAQPVILGVFLNWLTSPRLVRNLAPGLGAALGLAAVACAQIFIHHQLYYLTMRGGWNARIACTALVHRKLLRAHSAALGGADSNDGNIVNLVSNDVFRFDSFFPRLHFGWSGPLDFVVVFCLMVLRVGWIPALAGVGIIVLNFPLQIFLGRKLASIRRRTAAATDSRVQRTSELIEGILAVKAACWEPIFEAEVGRLRATERWSIFRAALIKAYNAGVNFSIPYISTLLTFVAFWAEGRGSLNIATVFSTMSLLHVLRISIGKNLTFFIESLPEAQVSVQRLQSFLLLPEHQPSNKPASDDALSEPALVHLDSASFAWGCPADKSSPVVSGITCRLAAGELMVVTGPTGCGKTALLQGILGEIDLTAGSRASMVGRVIATVSQQPWIMSGTLRENVVWDEHSRDDADNDIRFQRVMQACGLDEDVKQWEDGVHTKIGEKGVNLSGGQRARVALARAFYSSDAEVLLLDGVLSAVDPTVASQLLLDVIVPMCRQQGKAVCLATHSVDLCAPYANVLLRLKEDGTVAEIVHGTMKEGKTHAEATETPIATFGNGKEPEAMAENHTKNIDPNDERAAENVVVAATPTDIIVKEERTMGSVRCTTYVSYLNSAGVFTSSLIMILFLGGQVLALLADVSLESWSSSKVNQQDGWRNPFFQRFLYFTLAATVAGLSRAVLFFYVGLKASTVIHGQALRAVVRSPMFYFTANPLGRLLNKFSADLGNMDEQLPTILFTCLESMLLCLGCLCLAIVAIPWMAVPVLPLFLVLWWVRWYFLQSSRDLKRCEALSKSPVFVSFAANLKGRGTIRAFNKTQLAQSRFESALAANGRAWYTWLNVNRWVGFRLDTITLVVLACVVVGGALFGWSEATALTFVGNSSRLGSNATNSPSPGTDSEAVYRLDHGLLAIAITYCIQLSGVFQYMIRLSAKVETQMIAVERLAHLTRLPKEQGGKAEAPDAAEWPKIGRIQLDSLRVRYRSDLPLVLDGVSADIEGASKVGVCGRTGSGKSSLMLALCRLNQVHSGRVLIDGIDVATLPLEVLRGCIGVIPQTPSLFSGSLRYNVDPGGACSEDEIEKALASSGMRKPLDFRIEEAGRNLSVGEKQCVSLARALCLKRRIYIMDEATANIDYETDGRIQRMMREHPTFTNSTLITVAHRLETIRDSDRIIVLDAGTVVEKGAPSELEACDGFFARLVRDHDKGNDCDE